MTSDSFITALTELQSGAVMVICETSWLPSLITALLGSGYTQLLSFALVIVALALMPNGLFGRAEVKKV